MQNILVSIIIPVYKVEQYIERCLDSVLSQTYRNIEVILVDDCSPDHSMEKARQCIDKSPLSKDLQFKYLKHDHNRGLSAARNTGIDAAIGEYVYFLDSDDKLYDESSIENLACEIQRHNLPDIVCGSYEVIKGLEKKQRHKIVSFLNCQQSIIEFYTTGKTYMMAWNKMVKLNFLKHNNLYFMEGLIHEDDLWSYLLINKAQSFSQIEAVTYCYYENPNTIMTATSQRIHNTHRMTILKEIDKYYNNGYIIDCKENRIFIAKQKVYYWEAAMLNGITRQELLIMFWTILRTMANRRLFVYEYLLYFGLVLCGKAKQKLCS